MAGCLGLRAVLSMRRLEIFTILPFQGEIRRYRKILETLYNRDCIIFVGRILSIFFAGKSVKQYGLLRDNLL